MVLSSDHVLTTLEDPLGKAKPQQHGVDLTVCKICSLDEWEGETPSGVYKDATVPDKEHERLKSKVGDKYGWDLHRGIYSVYFDQGVKIPSNCKANIIHRSSIARCGGEIYSGEYDAGYETPNIGAFLVVHSRRLFIEEGARIAQIVMMQVEGEMTQYNGQWMGGKNN